MKLLEVRKTMGAFFSAEFVASKRADGAGFGIKVALRGQVGSVEDNRGLSAGVSGDPASGATERGRGRSAGPGALLRL